MSIYDNYKKYKRHFDYRGTYAEFKKLGFLPQLQKDESILCFTFGCGKHLSLTDKMYSDYCFKCQLKINQNKNNDNNSNFIHPVDFLIDLQNKKTRE